MSSTEPMDVPQETSINSGQTVGMGGGTGGRSVRLAGFKG